MRPSPRNAFLRTHQKQKGILLFLDFDGTLAPIVRQRQRARAGKAQIQALRLLIRPSIHKKIKVYVLSGRSRNDLASRFPMKGITLIGDHGYDAGRFSPSLPHGWKTLRSNLLGPIRKLISKFPGAYLEIKPVTLTIHYREVPPNRHGALKKDLISFLGPLERAKKLRASSGKRVLEIFPRTRWGKGSAAQAIKRSFGGNATIIAIGDDRTDEDVFRAFPSAITIHVGRGPSAARFFLRDPQAVARFLFWLARELHRNSTQ